MAHGVIGRLLGEAVLVHANELLNVHQALLISFEFLCQVVGRWEFVEHFIFHLLDALRVLLQLSLDRALQVLVLQQILVALLYFDLQLSCSALSIVQLLLLVIQLITHFINVFLRRQLVLAGKSLLHMHEKSLYGLLGFSDLLAVLVLLRLELLHVLVNLFLLFVEDLVLLHVIATVLLLVFQVVVDVFDVPLVCLDDLADVSQLLVLLLDLRVVLFDAIHQTLSRLGEGKVHLVGLQLEVLLSFRQLDFLVAQMLGTLLERVLLQSVLRVLHALVHVVEVLAVNLDFVGQSRVLTLERLVLVALLRVEVVQTGLVGEVNVLDLLLVAGQFVLHVLLLGEESVQVTLLLVVLVLDVHVKVLDIFGLGV